MANDPENKRLTILPEGISQDADEIVRLTPGDFSGRPLSTPAPEPATSTEGPVERLNVAPRSKVERRHEPDIEAILPQFIEDQSLEARWEQQNGHPLPWRWFILVCLLITAAIAWSLTRQWVVKEEAKRSSSAPSSPPTAVQTEAKEEEEAADRVERIMAHVKNFATATTLDQIKPLVRHPERVAPLMDHWYAEHPFQVDPLKSIDSFSPTYDPFGSFWVVGYQCKSGATKQVIVEELPGNRVAIDWETAVQYQPMDWSRYTHDRPTGSFNFRVTISPDTFYSHEFANSDNWISFRLTANGSEQTLFGFADRQSDLGTQLMAAVQENGNRPTMMILRLYIPPNLQSPCGVVIEKIESLQPYYLGDPQP